MCRMCLSQGMLFVLAAGGASAAATLGPLCEAPLLPLACRVRLGRPSAIESPPHSGGGSNVFARPFSKGRVPLSFTIPSAFRNFAIPAKFQPMAPLHGAGPLRRSEGVSKICPARSEAEEQRVQIFSPNGTAAVFRFLFGGKKEQSPLPAASAGKTRNLNLAAKVAGTPPPKPAARQNSTPPSGI